MSSPDESPKEGADRTHVLVSIIIVVVFFVGAAYYLAQRPQELSRLRGLPLRWLAVAAMGIGTSLVSNGLFIKLTMQGFGVSMPIREWLPLSLAVSGLNYVSPLRGGAALRGAYLRRRYGFSWIDFATTLAGATAVALLTHSVLGILALLALRGRGAQIDIPLLLFFSILAALLAWTLFFGGGGFSASKSRLLKPLARMAQGWQDLRGHPGLLPLLLLNGGLFFISNAFAFYAAFRALGISLGIAETTFYVASTGIASLVALTPGALGIQEAFSLYMSRVLPYSPADALMAQLIVRVLAVSILAITFPFAMKMLNSATPQSPSLDRRQDV